MLMDKGYYDYDYQKVKPKRKPTKEDTEIWSDDKVAAILGTAMLPNGERVFKKKPLTPAELQAEVMAEEKKKQENR